MRRGLKQEQDLEVLSFTLFSDSYIPTFEIVANNYNKIRLRLYSFPL